MWGPNVWPSSRNIKNKTYLFDPVGYKILKKINSEAPGLTK